MRGLPCDIFCSVVDNYGDIGVAWRLARQLHAEHGLRIRLWLDELAALHRIWPRADADSATQVVNDIEVRHWPAEFPAVTPAALVIEAFGCALPANYLAAMARREPRPLWLNLDYLSAESWVKGCHGLPSPHPRLPLTAYFFYPGFEPETGGLIREAGLLAQCRAYRDDPTAQARFWQSLGLVVPAARTLTVSLFAYDSPAIAKLLSVWAGGRQRVRCLVPEGVALEAAGRFIGQALVPGQSLSRGALEICALPFFDQEGYDRLLWSCDLNFVRGEDSFVRAHWVGLPLVWHIYPQEAGAHWPKLEAFHDLYCQGLDARAAAAYRRFAFAWNRGQGVAEAWPDFMAHMPALREHARAWTEHLAKMSDLAGKLMLFCKEKL